MATKSRRVGARETVRVGRASAPSVDSTGSTVTPRDRKTWTADCAVDCGWGRLLFAHTFKGPEKVVRTLLDEQSDQRDIAFYLHDPQMVLAAAPDQLFLDPSHTFRLWFNEYRPHARTIPGVIVTPVASSDEINEVNRIYRALGAVPVHEGFLDQCRDTRAVRHLLARDEKTGEIVGTVMGVDHVEAFHDTENGSSLWGLAVDHQSRLPAIGEALVRSLVERFQARGRVFMDLSVMHDNLQAIALYEKLGFRRVPVFAIKRRNSINEKLYVAPAPEERLNPYARIIVDEARRRGIGVEVLDGPRGYFVLSSGGRRVTCRESLSELTSAIAMSRCDDKSLTREIVAAAGVPVPAQQVAGTPEENAAFLEEYGAIVVKPARGEQGAGVAVDLRSADDVEAAVEAARTHCDVVLLEEFVAGDDLRVVVIDGAVVAAAVRKPAQVTGTGDKPVRELIERQSRRRSAATDGESRIPLDGETMRCIRAEDCDLDTILEKGRTISVRKTANLHTGGTIHDMTEGLHPEVAKAAVAAARALDMPVVGIDFMIPDLSGPDCRFIEANERPGLANHEPAPTAQRFVDLLFPQTARRE